MIVSPLASAQDFIKALRAHADPPHANGPSKIEIAREAWESSGIEFPNKDEVVVDWLLTRLLKDKAKTGWVLSYLSLAVRNEPDHTQRCEPDSRFALLATSV